MKKITILAIILITVTLTFGFSDTEYRQLVRNPKATAGTYIDFDGRVLQWIDHSDDGYDMYRIGTSGGYDNVVVYLVFHEYGNPMMMDGDEVIITNAYYRGTIELTTVLGVPMVLPCFQNSGITKEVF